MTTFCDENNQEAQEPKLGQGLATKLLDNRKILIAEGVDSKTAHRVMAELLYMKAQSSEEEIELK